MRISALLLAGGKGTRMGLETPKQYLKIKNKFIALYSLEALLNHDAINEVIVVADPTYYSVFKGYPVRFAPAGQRRQDSVFNGLEKVNEVNEGILVHDAARPLLTSHMIDSLIKAGKEVGAAALGIQATSTIKRANAQGFVDKTLDRNMLWEIQTPQFLLKNLLTKGKACLNKHHLEVTDDVSIAELLGHSVKLVAGSSSNLKITTKEDLAIAEGLL